MDKKTILAFLIIIVFLGLYSRFLPQKTTNAPPAPKSVVTPVQDEVPSSFSGEIVKNNLGPLDTTETFPTVKINEFIINYSPRGGYIASLSLGSLENTLPFQNIGFDPDTKEIEYSVSVNNTRIRFSDVNNNWKEFVFGENTIKISASSALRKSMVIFSNTLHSNMLDQRYQEIFWEKEGSVKRQGAKKIKDKEYFNVNFAGARNRYYCISLLSGDYDIKWVENNKTGYLYALSSLPEIILYVGPQSEKALKPFGLQGIMNYGFFHVLGIGMVKVLYFLHSITRSWGWSIILFAILIYVVLFPFTIKSTKAMKKMQLVQPEIEKIKAKCKDNPQKLQKETMGIYKKYKINPIGGCLPLFFQFPIFIALYQVLFRFVELKGAHFLWISDLSEPDHLFRLGFYPHYVNLLPILIMVIGLLQQKFTTGSSAAPEQKKMGLFFGVLLGVIFYNFPAALTLYWFVQNLLTFAYQGYMAKSQPSLESLK